MILLSSAWQLGLGSSKHAYERLMRAADTNNNGQLSFDEFVVWARSREQHLRVFFHEADTSRSGGISAAELKAAFLKHDRMAVTDSRIASLMRKLDKYV
jgi:solute carrier family 25 phosphate transporter 23/24/25/41